MSVRSNLRNHLRDCCLNIRTEHGYHNEVEVVIPFQSEIQPVQWPAIMIEESDQERYEEGPDPFITRFLPFGIHAFAKHPTTLSARPDEASDNLLSDLERAVDTFADADISGLIDVDLITNIRRTSSDGVYVALMIEVQYRTQRGTPGSYT